MPADETNIPGTAQIAHPPSIKEFRKIVLDHYRHHGRDFEWRRTTDPYRILVSEIMLQQTQVERVTLKFPEFIAAFPDFPSLAGAPLSDILSIWQGMGYNRRAISLQKCSKRIVEEFDGILPQDPEVLATFPGIGKATAASICAFAFNMPVVFIETNIRRVFIHYFFGDQEKVDDREILLIALKALPVKRSREWYNALMDLGAALKKSGKNPNLRSRHYSKQAAFEGSDRKLRGIILRMLLENPGQNITNLIRNTGEERERVIRITGSLEKEGFLTRTGTILAIRTRQDKP